PGQVDQVFRNPRMILSQFFLDGKGLPMSSLGLRPAMLIEVKGAQGLIAARQGTLELGNGWLGANNLFPRLERLLEGGVGLRKAACGQVRGPQVALAVGQGIEILRDLRKVAAELVENSAGLLVGRRGLGPVLLHVGYVAQVHMAVAQTVLVLRYPRIGLD